MKKIVKIMLLLICLVIFIISLYKVYDYLAQKSANKKINEELIEKAVIKQEIEDGKDNNDSLPISIDFSKLKEENKDIIAWIYSEGTPINYPIVQTDNNLYYLSRMINKDYNKAGTIFMDYRNNADFSDNNTIIYGHNMKSDMMFGTITNYTNQDYYEKHKEMYLFTENKNFKIKLLSGYIVPENSNIYNLDNSFEFINENSTFKSDIDVSSNDRLITLSTCSYEYEKARYILIGILKGME